MGETCKTCRWWASELAPNAAIRFQDGAGECRRRAPRGPVTYYQAVKKTLVSSIVSAFPYTLDGDWCGEHQPKEPTP